MGDNHTTVFYSWQSDSPSKLNRSFIEEALKQAIKQLGADAELQEALRDEPIHLDKDTVNVPGSPPITTTILSKIENCGAFVADLTFVGESTEELQKANKRRFPNPNVTIEYGYALKACGHEKIVGVMNVAYGEPSGDSLPFDLRHLRWPITYELKEADPQKADVLKRLVLEVVLRLKSILLARAQQGPSALSDSFVEASSDVDIAAHTENVSELIPTRPFKAGPVEGFISNVGRMFMRLHPVTKIDPFPSELAALRAIAPSCLRPMGNVNGWDCSRNRWGAVVWEAPHEGLLYHYTQLFLSKELWGLDALTVNSDYCRKRTSAGRGFIAPTIVEARLADTLTNYLEFFRKQLQLTGPFKLTVGLSGIKGYPMWVGRSGEPTGGCILQDQFVRSLVIGDSNQAAVEVLKPVFEELWEAFGESRPESHHKALLGYLER